MIPLPVATASPFTDVVISKLWKTHVLAPLRVAVILRNFVPSTVGKFDCTRSKVEYLACTKYLPAFKTFASPITDVS